MNQIEAEKPKRKPWTTMERILQDILKNAIWALLTTIFKIVWNIYGVTILFVLTTLFLFFLKWLTIPVTVPAYAFVIFFFLTTFGILIFQQIQRNAKTRRRMKIDKYGLAWKITKDKGFFGPLCPKCKENLPPPVHDQYANVKKTIFGKEPEYLYKCKCGYQLSLSKSLNAITWEFQEKHLLSEK